MGLRLNILIRIRHWPFLFKTLQKVRDHLPMVMSVTLHAVVVFLLTYDFVSYQQSQTVSVPVFVVDLTKVKVAEMTNLPPKLKKTTQKKGSKKSVRTSAYSKAPSASSGKSSGFVSSGASGGSNTSKSAKATATVKSNSNAAGSSTQSSGAFLESELNTLLDKVTTSKKQDKTAASAPASNSIKNTSNNDTMDDSFKTLLASVDGIKSGLGYASEDEVDINEDEMVTQGIEGGQGGSYMQDLSVSEKDLIGIKLRQCWNIDPGVRGAQNMLIEIRVFLDKTGNVKDVKILDKARYGKDSAFRSVAESARRAVYICDKKKEDSPFKIFPKNYEQSYETWKTLLLRFNPFDGKVG